MSDVMSRSFRLQRSDSYLNRIVGRSKSSRPMLESMSAECASLAAYQRLSRSTRLSEEPIRRHRKTRVWRLLSRAFLRNDGDGDEISSSRSSVENSINGKENKKKRSSWLPDPQRRWPVQGW